MSNLQTARAAIKAEIDYARQGLNFYQSRIEVLEQTLSQLEDVNTDEAGTSKRGRKAGSGRRGAKASAGQEGKGRRGRKAAADTAATTAGELPYTGGDYWLNLISAEPRTAAEVLRASIDSLGFEPNKAQVQKLRQRLTAALQLMLQASKIRDQGSGRERRYVRA